jgi:hypothetical protein
MARIDDHSEVDIDSALSELETKLNRLRVLYEQYFLGIERRPPYVLQKDVVRTMRFLEGLQLRNTAGKFRLRQIVQKFHSYRAYWLRTIREVENGTYRRHVQKVKNREARRVAQEQVEEEDSGEVEVDLEMESGPTEAGQLADEFLKSIGAAQKPDRRPPPDVRGMSAEEVKRRDAKLRDLKARLGLDPDAPITAASREKLAVAMADSGLRPKGARRRGPRKPKKATGGRAAQNERIDQAAREAGISRERVEKIYNSLIEAKKRTGESTAKLSLKSVAKSIAKQAPSIKKKYGVDKVDFRVVIKGGKAYLKPQTDK